MPDSNPINEMLHYERKAKRQYHLVIGLDEAGRGPLAGPVVASAVALKKFDFQNTIRDSKCLTALQREAAFHEIFENAYVGVGMMSETVVDSVNILNATFLAMDSAVRQLLTRLPPGLSPVQSSETKVCLLVDGNCFRTNLPFPYQTIVDGDALSLSIACASIIAKVTRDRILKVYGRIYPQYGFEQHKGYSTPEHREAIRRHGLSLIHRKSFTCL